MSTSIYEQTIDAIGRHVQEQPDCNDACFAGNEEKGVSHDCEIAMQWMKPEAASVRIKHRIGHEMIQINQHRKQEDEIDPEPSFTIDEEGY